MIQIPGYHIAKELHSTSSSRVFYGTRERDGLAVVLKLYLGSVAELPGSEQPSRAHFEFEVLHRLSAPGVIRAVALESVRGQDVLVMERTYGTSLADYVQAHGALEIDVFLQVALSITHALAYVHSERVVHGDLKLENILIEPTSHETCLVDFGLSRELGQLRRVALPEAMCGSLRYLSPEQTGRTRHSVDFRSDLYSLGMVFYALLTQRLPFEGKSALALIHSHIAVVPAPPQELNPSVPKVISDLVMRLLEKEPDARYQSAYGLARDLEACRSTLRSDGRIDAEIVLGQNDALERPRFTDHVVGRSAEIEALHQAVARTEDGGVELLSIHGPAGIGKSALCSLLHSHATSRGAYVACTRFEADRSNIPYAGLAGILSALVEQVLVESAERFDLWREVLRRGLGRIGAALQSIAPDLALIVEDFPELAPLGPEQARDRLVLAVRRFFLAFSELCAHIVLIFDDVHWADEGSIRLVRELLADDGQHHLLVVLASRSDLSTDQVDRASAHADEIVSLEKEARTQLVLAPLSADEVNDLIAETLGMQREETRALSEVIGLKISRNPLQIQRLIEMMWERGTLVYRHGDGWKWDLAQLAAFEVAPDLAVWMIEKLRMLPAKDRELLTLASIQPGAFDLDTLVAAHQGDRSDLLQSLMGLVETGVLLPCREGFKFSHERVREAAQSLMSAEQCSRLHFEAGLGLLAKEPDPGVPERIFVMAEHLRRGYEHVTDEVRVPVLLVQLEAGRRALAAGAPVQASDFLLAGTELFSPSDWEQQPDLGFDLHLQLAATFVQLNQFTRASSILKDLGERRPNRVQYARISAQRIHMLALAESPDVCARYSLRVLAELGLKWPLNPSKLRARFAYLKLRWVMWGRPTEALFPEKPAGIDPNLAAIFVVLNACGHILSRIDVRLALLASCTVLEHFVRKGCLRAPAYSLAAEAVAEHALTADSDRLRRNAERVEVWLERMPDPMFSRGARLQLGAQIRPWLTDRRSALTPLPELGEIAREIGSSEGVYYASFLDTYYRALAGDSVALACKRLCDLAAEIEASGHEYAEPMGCAIVLRYFSAALVTVEHLDELVGEVDEWLESNDGRSDIHCRTLLLILLCVLGRYDLAFAQSQAVFQRLFRVLPNVHIADHVLFRGLAAAELARTSGHLRGVRYVFALRACLSRMRRWARGGPDFLHMLMLLQAKRAEAWGHTRRADLMLARAAERARKQNFPNHAALAHEARATLLRRQNRLVDSESALRDAIDAYEIWGVQWKVSQLCALLSS